MFKKKTTTTIEAINKEIKKLKETVKSIKL